MDKVQEIERGIEEMIEDRLSGWSFDPRILVKAEYIDGHLSVEVFIEDLDETFQPFSLAITSDSEDTDQTTLDETMLDEAVESVVSEWLHENTMELT